MNYHQGVTNPSGALALRVIREQQPSSVLDIIKRGLPNKSANPAVNEWRKSNMMRLLRGSYKVWLADKMGGPAYAWGALYLTIVKPVGDVSDLLKEYADNLPLLHGLSFQAWASEKGMAFKYAHLGLAGTKVVTDVGVAYIVDAFQNSVELENMKYAGLGTGTTAEAAADTALVTELTTEYTGNVRATGTTTEGATANIYRTVATNTLDGTPGAALREHGVFSASTVGVLLDRTVYSAITLSSGDGLQSTYDLTLTAGS